MNTALLVSMASPTSCVHVIDGDNYETMVEDDNLVVLISERSKIKMLDVDSLVQLAPNPVWFGSEPKHDWCYYYQKASLYRQQEKWKELNQLADEVIEAGITPQQADEWLPMYEGYIQTKQMEGANFLSNILKSDELFVTNYCPAKLALLENGTERQKYVTGDLCSWFIEMYR
jgi:hypothetical protein